MTKETLLHATDLYTTIQKIEQLLTIFEKNSIEEVKVRGFDWKPSTEQETRIRTAILADQREELERLKAELESGEWLNENCVTLEMQLKSCQHLCESITNRLSVVLEECDYYDQERRNTIHLAPARTQKGRQVTIPPEVDAILAKMMENAEKEKKA